MPSQRAEQAGPPDNPLSLPGALWSMAGPRLRAQLVARGTLLRLPAGASVAGEPQLPARIGFVVSGILRLIRRRRGGERQILGLLCRGDMFGGVFSRAPALAVEAATAAEVVCFERGAFEALLVRHPELEHAILLSVSDEVDAARALMTILGNPHKPARVASFLVRLARDTRAPPADGQLGLTLPVGRHDLADYLGTTVETISRTLHALASAGVIRIADPRRIVILDLQRLVEVAEGDAPGLLAEPATPPPRPAGPVGRT